MSRTDRILSYVNWRNAEHLLVLILLAIVLYEYFPPYIYIAISGVITWLKNWGQVIGGLGSALLSFFLVLLYYKQQEILLLNHQPLLQLTEYTGGTGDQSRILRTKITNTGKGTAVGIQLHVEPKFFGNDAVEPVPSNISLSYQRDDPSKNSQTINSNLRPTDGSMWFEATPMSFFWKEIDSDTAEESIVGSEPDTLVDMGVDRVRLKMRLEYKDTQGNRPSTDESQIDLVVPISDEITSVGGAIDSAISYSDYRMIPDKVDPFSEDNSVDTDEGNVSLPSQISSTNGTGRAQNMLDDDATTAEFAVIESEEGRKTIRINNEN